MGKINMDFSKRTVINSTEFQIFENDGFKGGRRTSIISFKKGELIEGLEENSLKEIIIIAGELRCNDAVYSIHSYFRIPIIKNISLIANTDVTIFIKENAGVEITEKFYAKPASENWLQGYGNLLVMPLHDLNTDSTSLVKWPAGEIFKPHKHWGGEEIFVISGEFKDEHGSYPAGTWIRSPHLSSHKPFVEVDTIILVKIGHLLT